MTGKTTEQPATAKGIPELTRTHKILIGVVVVGAVIIASIGFAGSYAAVHDLAVKKGFGDFALVFPVGIDAGIVVLLALDLLLTWIRIPFPLLRQTAWLLTAATIAFNGAAAWPDPLGVGMHAVIPVLFVVSVEAARHAIGRIADVTADKHMEGVRLSRWLLSPVPTFLLWRRMKLWELRSYEQVIKLEQDRYVYQTWLQSQFGKNWRKAAKEGRKGGSPVELLMPLRLARYGKPLAETVPAVLTATGYEVPALFQPRELPPGEVLDTEPETAEIEREPEPEPETEHLAVEAPHPAVEPEPEPEPVQQPEAPVADWQQEVAHASYAPYAEPEPQPETYEREHRVEESAVSYGQPFTADPTEPISYEQPEPVAAPEPYAQPEPEPQPVAEPVAEVPAQPEPAPAAPARSTAPKRVEARVEDDSEGEAPARGGRGANTRARVAEIYRNLPEEERALRGRPLARVISDASNGELKFDTVKRSHISEELLAKYLQSAPQVPGPREEAVSEDVR
ncbi:DUF2637 domain-containing protein [Streptomyces sp. NPDC048192]|uniref:DUF2637 domain-containing protein n=1 Tax=Streptomyces sp. NPDC048192 TaxID=3365510 RepID=UPI003717408C